MRESYALASVQARDAEDRLNFQVSAGTTLVRHQKQRRFSATPRHRRFTNRSEPRIATYRSVPSTTRMLIALLSSKATCGIAYSRAVSAYDPAPGGKFEILYSLGFCIFVRQPARLR